MEKKELTLEFRMTVADKMQLLRSEKLDMIQWCMDHHMDVVSKEDIASMDSLYRITFKRDKTTLDFIKIFLESKVRQALPFSSLESIPGVRIV